MSSINRDSFNWYVVHTHPKQEDRTTGNLKTWGIETLNPKLLTSRPNQYTGRLIPVVRPLFPGYIFARFRFNELYHKVRFTRGVHSLVCFNNTPAPVDEDIVDFVRSRIGVGGYVEALEELKAGDQVVINEGEFQNLRGVFERDMDDAERVRILLSTVSFQAHVVIDRALVNKVPQEKRSSRRAPGVADQAA